MDQLLLPYLQASEESERQRHLDELLLIHAVPVVRQALRQKLSLHVDQRGVNPHNQDAEDLFQEIMAKVVQTLHDLRSLEVFRVLSPGSRNTGVAEQDLYIFGFSAMFEQPFCGLVTITKQTVAWFVQEDNVAQWEDTSDPEYLNSPTA